MMRRILLLFIVLIVGLAKPVPARSQDALAQAEQLRNGGHFAEAVRVLRARLLQVPDDLRAQLMLAETLYWQGDFSGARRYFRAVLERDSGNVAVRRQLAEIEAATASWLRLQAERLDDNQPVDRNRFDLQGGLYLTPLWSIGARVNPEWAMAGDTTLDLLRVEGSLAGYFPQPRVELELAGGVTRWHSLDARGSSQLDAEAVEPTGRARLGLRAGRGLVLSAVVDRTLYTATVASLAAPVLISTPRLVAHLDRGGWLGEAASQRESYPDDNSITTIYAWLLAPLVRASATLVHAGYAFSYQDAANSRFIALVPARRSSSGTFAGRYDPYFTPEREMQHGIAASLAFWRANGARVQVNGSYAVYARRDVPIIADRIDQRPPNRTQARDFTTETFHPYTVHAAGSLPLGRRTVLTVEAERMRTAFYQQTRLAALISLRFVPRAIP